MDARAAYSLAEQNAKKTGPSRYNTDIGLRKWRASLAKLKTGATMVVNLSVAGDSISEGGYAGTTVAADFQTKGYVGRLRSALAAKFGNVGMGFVSPVYPFGSPYWSKTGWAGGGGGFGATGAGISTSISGNTLTWTTPTCTGFSLFFGGNNATGAVTIAVDGGAPVNFDTVQSGSTVNGKVEYSLDGLSSGTHTVVITKTNDGKTVYFLGSYEHVGTTGVRVHNVSRWGMKAVNGYSDLAMQLEINQWSPALTIVGYLANDAAQLTDIASYTSQMQTIITRGQQFGDVLLLSLGANTTTTYNVQAYADVMKQLAIKNNCAYIDVLDLWGGNGTYASTTLGLLYDNVHPNDYGHEHIAGELIDVLLGSRY